MHNFFFFSLCALSAITSSFATITNSNPANLSKPTLQLTPNGTKSLFPTKDIESTFLTKRDRDSFEDLEKRIGGEVLYPEVFPYNVVGFVLAGDDSICTGILVGLHHVLVPAHCIYKNGGYLKDKIFKFPDGSDSSQSGRVSCIQSADAIVHPRWLSSKDNYYDIGLLVLDNCPRPIRAMPFGWFPNLQSGSLMYTITWANNNMDTLWRTFGLITNIEDEVFYLQGVDNSLDGSPVYPHSYEFVYGIITRRWTRDGIVDYQAVRITEEKRDLIWEWINYSINIKLCQPRNH